MPRLWKNLQPCLRTADSLTKLKFRIYSLSDLGFLSNRTQTIFKQLFQERALDVKWYIGDASISYPTSVSGMIVLSLTTRNYRWTFPTLQLYPETNKGLPPLTCHKPPPSKLSHKLSTRTEWINEHNKTLYRWTLSKLIRILEFYSAGQLKIAGNVNKKNIWVKPSK